MKINVKLVEGGRLPEYKTEGAAGADCFARLEKTLEVYPHTRAKIPLGFCIELPAGFEMQVRGRSGLADKKGIDVFVGTVDSDYRGEVCAILFNTGSEILRINSGDRIAQAIISPVVQAGFNLTEKISDTERGESGFGSTGV